MLAFENEEPFTKCITNIGGTTIGDAENVYLVMQIYILIEYGLKYFDALGMLCFYSKDEAVSFNSGIVNIDYFEPLKYKTKSLGNTEAAMVHRFLRNCCIIKIPQ